MTRKEVEALMQEHPPLQSMHNACINAVCRSWLDLEAENARLERLLTECDRRFLRSGRESQQQDATIAELREALKPFAERGGDYLPYNALDNDDLWYVSGGNLRRAKAVYDKTGGE